MKWFFYKKFYFSQQLEDKNAAIEFLAEMQRRLLVHKYNSTFANQF